MKNSQLKIAAFFLIFSLTLTLLPALAQMKNSQAGETAIPIPAKTTSREVEAWKEKISLYLPAIIAALKMDKSAVGVYDVRPLSGGRVGVGTITDYGYSTFHVYDPASQKIIYSEAVIFNRADRERFSIFFVRVSDPRVLDPRVSDPRETPLDNYYRYIPVTSATRDKDASPLGWLGIPQTRLLEEKGAMKEKELLNKLTSMEAPNGDCQNNAYQDGVYQDNNSSAQKKKGKQASAPVLPNSQSVKFIYGNTFIYNSIKGNTVKCNSFNSNGFLYSTYKNNSYLANTFYNNSYFNNTYNENSCLENSFTETLCSCNFYNGNSYKGNYTLGNSFSHNSYIGNSNKGTLTRWREEIKQNPELSTITAKDIIQYFKNQQPKLKNTEDE